MSSLMKRCVRFVLTAALAVAGVLVLPDVAQALPLHGHFAWQTKNTNASDNIDDFNERIQGF